jgi:hypothetical protein
MNIFPPFITATDSSSVFGILSVCLCTPMPLSHSLFYHFASFHTYIRYRIVHTVPVVRVALLDSFCVIERIRHSTPGPRPADWTRTPSGNASQKRVVRRKEYQISRFLGLVLPWTNTAFKSHVRTCSATVISPSSPTNTDPATVHGPSPLTGVICTSSPGWIWGSRSFFGATR